MKNGNNNYLINFNFFYKSYYIYPSEKTHRLSYPHKKMLTCEDIIEISKSPEFLRLNLEDIRTGKNDTHYIPLEVYHAFKWQPLKFKAVKQLLMSCNKGFNKDSMNLCFYKYDINSISKTDHHPEYYNTYLGYNEEFINALIVISHTYEKLVRQLIEKNKLKGKSIINKEIYRIFQDKTKDKIDINPIFRLKTPLTNSYLAYTYQNKQVSTVYNNKNEEQTLTEYNAYEYLSSNSVISMIVDLSTVIYSSKGFSLSSRVNKIIMVKHMPVKKNSVFDDEDITEEPINDL